MGQRSFKTHLCVCFNAQAACLFDFFHQMFNEMVETGRKAGQIHIEPDIKPLEMHVKEPPWLFLFPPSAPSILQQKHDAKLPEITCDNKQHLLRSCYSLGQTQACA